MDIGAEEVVVVQEPSSTEDQGTEQVKEEVEVKPEVKAEEPIPRGVQRRIDRAVRQKYEAEARARAFEERLAVIEARQAPRAPSRDDEPTIDKFDNFDEYVTAKAAHIAKQQIESTLTEREQRQAEERYAREQAQVAEKWNKQVTKATAELPDFEEVLSSSDLPMTQAMRQTILESDAGPKLAYYLATHPEETDDISRMTGTAAIRALGRIEERLLSQKPGVTTTRAAEPIKPVGTRTSVKKDPGKMSDAEYEKWRKSA